MTDPLPHAELPAADPCRVGTVSGSMFDGRSGRRIAVTVCRAGAALRIDHEDGRRDLVALGDLVVDAGGPAGARLNHRAIPGWRVDLPDGLPPEVTADLAPVARYGRWIDRVGLGRAALAGALISAVLVGAVLTAPRWLGPLVPMAVERRIGDVLIGNLANSTCHTPAGDAALARLVREVDFPAAESGQPPVEARVVNFPMVNAVALPGNRIVLFSGLFDLADDPDMVAGVVAHELGHARKRHVMQALLREFGLSALTVAASGTVPTRLGQLTGLRYSRQAEAEADRFARERLAAAQISTVPTAAFFDAMAQREPAGAWLQIIASHPAAAARAAEFRAAFTPGQPTRPALSTQEWQALRGICKNGPKPASLLDL